MTTMITWMGSGAYRHGARLCASGENVSSQGPPGLLSVSPSLACLPKNPEPLDLRAQVMRISLSALFSWLPPPRRVFLG